MSQHIVSPKIYLLIFITLMAFTALTVAAAFVNFGSMNAVIALAIAFFKTTLVVLYFMHLRYSTSLIRLVVVAGLLWLAILLVLLMSDYLSRGWLPVPTGW